MSCLLLLLLTFLAVNPVVGSSVFAEGNEDVGDLIGSGGDDIDDSYGGNAADYGDTTVATDNENEDGIMELTATTSLVGISFSPAQYYASLSPTAAGQSARIDLTATINVANSGGYTVYLKSSSTNLVGVNNSSNVIPGASSAKTYANMDVNTWGYASTVGTSVSDSATYKAIAVSGNGDKLAENADDEIETDTKTIALSFATKINDAKPADTYSNTMTLSVVSEPMEVVTTWAKLTTMQEMTPVACYSAASGASKQLKDVRDGKYYWVSKLVDGRCWMTQNLDLDLSKSKALTSVDSDVTSSWTPGYDTAATVSDSTVLADNTGQRSWSLGNYRITDSTVNDLCGTGKADIAACVGTDNSRFTPYTTPTSANNDTNAHYIVGNHYQWCAATADCKNSSGQTGSDFTSGEAINSICPKGWRLPTATNTAIGSFQNLLKLGSIESNYSGLPELRSAPYYFVNGGAVWQDTYLFSVAGSQAYYWTSSSYFDVAFSLHIGGSTVINSTEFISRQLGFSVRCIAR